VKLFFDIDTQIDFMFPAGALYVPGAEKLIPLIATLNRMAVSSGGKVISTACAHSEDDLEFKQWPPHCVVATVGQTKPCALLLEPNSGQIILEKQKLDLFSNPKTDELVRSLNPDECIVYGVVTEFCVKLCAMGLLDRGYKVSLVREAIQTLNEADSEAFLRDFLSRPGASLWRGL
jgi:nicotinamidase/pyrazinamidase